MDLQKWHLLRDPDEWAQYCRKCETTYAVQRCTNTAGPRSYPAMVCATLRDGVMSMAVMYVADAKALLESMATSKLQPAPLQPAGVTASQADFNQHVSAMLLAVVNTMIEGRQITRERFEAKLAAFKALADQVAAGNRDPAAFRAVDGAGIVFPAPLPVDTEPSAQQQHEPPPAA